MIMEWCIKVPLDEKTIDHVISSAMKEDKELVGVLPVLEAREPPPPIMLSVPVPMCLLIFRPKPNSPPQKETQETPFQFDAEGALMVSLDLERIERRLDEISDTLGNISYNTR